jgi:hypothetical protein
MYEFQVPLPRESGGNWPYQAHRLNLRGTPEHAGRSISLCTVETADKAGSGPIDRPAFIEAAGRLVCLSVSVLYGIGLKDLTCRTRGKAKASRARQVAMYVMHTSLSMTYQEVADFFNRDRTTVSHACAMVEDARDRKETDSEISVLETLVDAARVLAVCQGETR